MRKAKLPLPLISFDPTPAVIELFTKEVWAPECSQSGQGSREDKMVSELRLGILEMAFELC